MITIFERDWGNLLLMVSWDKIDFLPRITATGMTHAFIFNVGFLMVTFNLTIWDKPMREFNRRKSMNSGQ
jgi:hypothetical protein